MASVNKVILVGNLGKDPESRVTGSGEAVCTFSIATTESWRDKSSGERKDITEWHKVVAYGKLAEIAGEYLRKGSQVYVEGKIKTRKWQDNNGQDRYTTEINASALTMLGKKVEDEGGRQQPKQQGTSSNRHNESAPPPSDLDDDIPF